MSESQIAAKKPS